MPNCRLEIVRQARHRGVQVPRHHGRRSTYTHFEDKPTFDEVDVIASRYLDEYTTGKLDRLDVVYTKFESMARQQVVDRNAAAAGRDWRRRRHRSASRRRNRGGRRAIYEFLPSPESILEEVVPASFKVKLFKCFLDSAVSEQIARMVAMKSGHRKRRRPDPAT